MVHYAVLGSVELFRDGQRRSLGGLRQRALLIEFLVHANEELSTDRLIDDVWGSEGSVKRLHTAIKRLRDALGPGPDGETPLRRTTSGYRLVVAAGELDADVFEQAVLEASAAIGDDPLRARDLVEHALTLWRGPALADVAYESFAQDAIRRLNERRADAEELCARAELLLGRGNDAIRRLDELVAKHPERGAVVALLMEALYAAGRQEQALATYQRMRRHLLGVGLEPGPELVALERRIHLRDATLAAGPELPPALRRLPPCVGRDDERAQFKEVFDEAREGSRRVVCIGGEPGVGKTLLAGHAALLAHDEGFVVGWGASFESVQAPYATWIEPLSELASRAPSEVLDRYRPQLSRVVPSIAEGDAAARDRQTAHFDPEGSRYRLFDAVLGLLSDLAAESPVLIAFDDVQWADSDSLALVHYVTEALRDGLPCTLVLTYRDTELDASPALQDLLASLRRVEGVTRLRLAGLGATDIAALVTGRMTHAPHGGWTQLVGQISSATGGNPFFIGEMLRHIEENTGPRSLSEIGVPEGVHDVVRQRVRRVGADAHAVLGPAAVIGHEFSVDVLTRLVEIDDPVPALDAAAAAALVVPQGIGRYAFAHTLIWRSVYESLSETRRALMHQRVAAALEADAGHDPGQLAHHLTRSGLASEQHRAATFAMQAGADALKQYAPGVAKGWFSEALRLLQTHGGDVDVCDVLIGLGEAKRRAGDRSFRRNLLKVARVATRRGDHELLARAVLANTMGGFGAAGSADRLSLQALEDAYLRLPEHPQRPLLTATLARERYFGGQPESGTELSRQALEEARRCTDPLQRASVMAMAMTISPIAPLAEYEQLVEELTRICDDLDDPELRFRAANAAFIFGMHSGEPVMLAAGVHVMRALDDVLDQPILHWTRLWAESAMCTLAGDLAGGEKLTVEAEIGALRRGRPQARIITFGQLLSIKTEQGALDQMRERLEIMIAANPAMPVLRLARGFIDAETGQLDRAEQLLDRVAAGGFRFPFDRTLAFNLARCADIAIRVERLDVGAELYRKLLPFHREFATPAGLASRGSIELILGRLATLGGDLEAAQQHLQRALTAHERLQAPLLRARTLLALAEALQASGNHASADERAGEALRLARRYGSSALELELQQLRRPRARA